MMRPMDGPHGFIASCKPLKCVCGRFLEDSLHFYAMPGITDTPARDAANAEHQGEELTKRMRQPPASIDSKARELEQFSPLFRGTAADPQDQLF